MIDRYIEGERYRERAGERERAARRESLTKELQSYKAGTAVNQLLQQ